jgi:hypothetical protein
MDAIDGAFPLPNVASGWRSSSTRNQVPKVKAQIARIGRA